MKKDILNKMRGIDEENTDSHEVEGLVRDLLSYGNLTLDDIKEVLSINSNWIKIEFLRTYDDFKDEDLLYIGEYIIANLDNPDRMYCSDLMEFAIDNNLELPYKKCLEFLERYEEEDVFPQLAAMEYISNNFKILFFEDVFNLYIKMINSSDYAQVAQVRALFFLFRITMKKEYLSDLLELVITENHYKLLSNILKDQHNSQEYFEYHDFLTNICESPYINQK